MSKVLKLLLALLSCAALHCGAAAAQETAAAGYKDATGALVPYGMRAERIVSLAPNVTEMLYYLGLGERLVGRSDYCNYPEQARQVAAVGGFADASLERIVALKPQLVVAYQGNDRELVDQLRQAGITVLALLEAASLEAVRDQMCELYMVATTGDSLPSRIGEWNMRLKRLSVPDSVSARPNLFFGYPGEMSVTCGPGTFLNDVIWRAGAFNIVTAEGQRWPMVSAEYVIGAQPEWLLTATACTGGETAASKRDKLLRQLTRDAVWSTLPAVQQKHVVVIDSDILLRPGPRILDALEQLRCALHPGWK
jgi:iron complex transport system substrate-binding protein